MWGYIYIGNAMECPWMSATCSLMASSCARSERERPKSAEIERPKVKVPTSAVAVSKEGNSWRWRQHLHRSMNPLLRIKTMNERRWKTKWFCHHVCHHLSLLSWSSRLPRIHFDFPPDSYAHCLHPIDSHCTSWSLKHSSITETTQCRCRRHTKNKDFSTDVGRTVQSLAWLSSTNNP